MQVLFLMKPCFCLRGSRPVIRILALGLASAVVMIPFAIFDGESLPMLSVPQCITHILKSFGTSPFLILNNMCCVRSPPIPKFRAFVLNNGPKYLDHTLLYLNRPFIMESPIKRISVPSLL